MDRDRIMTRLTSTDDCRDALYEDVVTNIMLASRYTEYMLNGLDSDPADFLDPSSQPKAALNGSS